MSTLRIRKWQRLFALAGFVLWLTAPSLAVASNTNSGEEAGPVQLEAEQLTFDQANATYLAEGDVLLRRGEQVLQAEQVRWNDETSQADAFGDVRLTGADGDMFGEELHLNLDRQEGLIRNGRVFVRESNFHIIGTEIEKTGERTYRVEDGTFTTCDGEVPSWKFTARELDVTVDGMAWAQHVFFHIYDLPVLYLPVVGYPVMTERESGLLMPNAGYSDKRGTELSLTYYQVLGRNQDATFYLDYLSLLGLGKGVEYRYFLGHDNVGEAKAYHVSGFSGEDDRFALDWQHRGTLPGQVRLTADIMYISEREYFSDFGDAAGEYNRDKAESLIAASRNWQKNNLAGQVKYVKDLGQFQSLTLHRLPEVRFNMIRQRIGDTPLYYRMDSSAAYLYQDQDQDVDQDLKSGRFSLRPALSAVFRPAGVVEIVPEIGYLERYYTGSDGEGREGIFDFSTRVATRFSRVYSFNGKWVNKIQHVVQPEILYQYVPSVNQADLPQFESFDEIGKKNTVSMAITNRFIAKLEPADGNADYHEFMYLRISQEYALDESRRELLTPSQVQEEDFSDLRLELLLRPNRQNFIDLDTRYDVGSGADVLTFNAATGINDQNGNSLALTYRYGKDDFEYLGGFLNLALLRPWYVSYGHRYSLDGNNNLENLLNLEYRAPCWSAFLTFRNRQGDQEVFISFSLRGLGRTPQFGRQLGRRR